MPGIRIVQVISGGELRQHVEARVPLQALQHGVDSVGVHDHPEIVAELRRGETVAAELLLQDFDDGVVRGHRVPSPFSRVAVEKSPGATTISLGGTSRASGRGASLAARRWNSLASSVPVCRIRSCKSMTD